MAKEETDFTIPEKFLSQLKEFSNGGFFLLTFSSLGKVVVHTASESEKDDLALNAALENYLNALQSGQLNSQEDEEEEEDSEGDKAS